jgi:hypothetical protein
MIFVADFELLTLKNEENVTILPSFISSFNPKPA